MSLIPLRQYQLDAIGQVRARVAAGILRLVLVLATGGGKTIVASHIIASAIAKRTRCLFLARRREIIRQTFCKLVRNGIDPSQVGIIMADVSAGPAPAVVDLSLSDQDLWIRYARRRPSALVQVASVDTLRSRAKPVATLVIVDECHGSLAKSLVDLIVYYHSACVIGLTATPYRGDNRGLGEDVQFTLPDGRVVVAPLFQDLVPIVSPRQLVAEGFLVEPRVWTVPDSCLPDISRVRIKGGEYDPEMLSAAVDRDPLVGNVVDHWCSRARGVRTVVFPCSVAHSHHVVDRFRGAGVPAEHLDGNTPTGERDAILARLERGETLVVSSVGVLVEGWDQPSVKCAGLLTPTRSTGRYLQMAGRILRPWQGQEAIILDHAGCTLDHGFVTDEREFTLEAGRVKGPSAAPAKTCKACWAVVPVSCAVCPGCGTAFGGGEGAERGVPEEAAGELIEVVAPSDSDLRAVWSDLCAECVKLGAKPGWVWAKWKEKFPTTKPPAGCVAPSEADCNESKSRRVELLDSYLTQAVERGMKVGWAKQSFKTRDGQWPSFALFERTATAEWLRVGLAAWERVVRMCEAERRRVGLVPAAVQSPVVQRVEPPTPITVPPANDLIDYNLTG